MNNRPGYYSSIYSIVSDNYQSHLMLSEEVLKSRVRMRAGSSAHAHIIVCVCYGIFTQLTSLAENNQDVSNSSHVYVTATFSQSFEFIVTYTWLLLLTS